jgi:NRDE-2, necessary for RNA interference
LYGLPLSTQLESLECFWDSEFPRIGEKHAQGWAVWEKTGRPDYISHPAISHQPQTFTVSDPYQKWAAEEVNADLVVIPSRSAYNTDDPYSTILFSDLRPLLVSLQSIETKCVFRLIWLSFLGLHIPGFWATLSQSPSENLDDRWCHTHLIASSYLHSIFPREVMTKRAPAESRYGVLVGSEKHYSDGFGPVKNWGYGAFDPHAGLVNNRNQTLWTKRDVSCVHEEFVRNVFQQCRMGNKDVEWDSLAVAFETGMNSKRRVSLLHV